MQLQSGLWIQGAYYIEFDHFGQLRIVGPHNHLHFGAVGIDRDQIEIEKVESYGGSGVAISGYFKSAALFFHDPAMGHIRKVREFIKPAGHPGQITLDEVVRRHPGELAPSFVGYEVTTAGPALTYKRSYGSNWYGFRLELANDTTVERSAKRRGFDLQAQGARIHFRLIPDSSPSPTPGIDKVFSAPAPMGDPKLVQIMDRTQLEIEHMLRFRKTSGFDYGTVFPRDWMESADLGDGDLTPAARKYMYLESLKHVDYKGQGWHENIVGEYNYLARREIIKVEDSLEQLVRDAEATKERLKSLVRQAKAAYINRNMIDIEPHYLIGFDRLMAHGLDEEVMDRLKLVAKYVLEQAEEESIITFKQIPGILKRHKDESYFSAGNWRDGEGAYKRIHPVIAPYDVNVVLYPQALQVMLRHAKLLELDESRVSALIKKWSRVKDWFRFTNHDGQTAFALALYDIRQAGEGISYKKLAVNHTDEAYELFYGDPDEADVISFCQRLLDPEYFFTKSGPTVVGANDGYPTTVYHGRVIWTKQTAFTIAGLECQLKSKAAKDWNPKTKELVTEALDATARTSIKAWSEIGGVPELHYDQDGHARRYDEQPEADGPMNMVQLWSAVGARRIIRAYKEVVRYAA